MGLAVAYQLVLDGHQPVLFEADDRVGGMTATFDFAGLEIERYYHFHCISDHAFLKILEELGISEKMRWTETKVSGLLTTPYRDSWRDARIASAIFEWRTQ